MSRSRDVFIFLAFLVSVTQSRSVTVDFALLASMNEQLHESAQEDDIDALALDDDPYSPQISTEEVLASVETLLSSYLSPFSNPLPRHRPQLNRLHRAADNSETDVNGVRSLSTQQTAKKFSIQQITYHARGNSFLSFCVCISTFDGKQLY